MTWTYSQGTGELTGPDGLPVAVGYSGSESGGGKNCGDKQAEKCVGPIPRGRWFISSLFDSQSHGPFCLRLDPLSSTETFGRSGFLIHGDSVRFPGEASQGCVILPRRVREAIWASEDRDLEVVA